MDNMGQMYKDYFRFREENPSGNKKKGIIEKRMVCEKFEFNKYKLLTEKCL